MARLEVRAIADFEGGKPVPIKFKFINQDQELTTVKVDKIIKKDISNHAGNRMLIFYCESIEGNVSRPYELRYEVDTCKWYFYY